MRLLHTSDWHIGKPFAVSRLTEQEAVLAEITEIAAHNRVDCVLVSGDVFDSRAPSAEAEKIVFSFFADLVKRGIAAVIIGGKLEECRHAQSSRGRFGCKAYPGESHSRGSGSVGCLPAGCRRVPPAADGTRHWPAEYLARPPPDWFPGRRWRAVLRFVLQSPFAPLFRPRSTPEVCGIHTCQ